MHGAIGGAAGALTGQTAQSALSGAAGAAASSALAGAFNKLTPSAPDETQSEKEAKRNLILNLVAGGTAAAGGEASTATSTATAEVDNNWLSLKQMSQVGKKLFEAVKEKDPAKAINTIIEAKRTSDKQDFATTESFIKSIADEGINDIGTNAELLTKSQSDVVSEGYNNIKKTIEFFSDKPVEDIKQGVTNAINGFTDEAGRIGEAVKEGDVENAKYLGKVLGKSAYQGATIAAAGGGIIKGGAALAKAVTKKVAEAAVKQSTKAAAESVIKSTVKAEIKTAAKTTENLAKSETETLRGARNPAVKDAIAKGQSIHKEWAEQGKYGEGFEAKRTQLDSGKRPDAINWKKKEVVELKPNNPRAIKRGEKQVENYRKELEKITEEKWTGKVKTYDN